MNGMVVSVVPLAVKVATPAPKALPRLLPRISVVAPGERVKMDPLVVPIVKVSDCAGSAASVITDPEFARAMLLLPWLMASDVAVVEFPRIVKLPLRKRPLPPRRLGTLVPELSSTYEPPVFTVSAVLVPLNAPEPWRRKTPPFTVVLV